MLPKIRTIQFICLATLASLLLAQTSAPSTSIKPFTISKETTLVTDPLNPDGTINYVQAINDILSKDVTPENNAAIPLLQATTNTAALKFNAPAAEALNITLDEKSALISIEHFAAEKQGADLSNDAVNTLDKEFDDCRKKPWKSADHPLIAEWLTRNEHALTLVESACTKPRCFLPWLSKSTPPIWSDAMPPLWSFRYAAEALMVRAMHRAGDGKLRDAFADIKRARQLSRFCTQQRTVIAALVAVPVETDALRGYDAIVATGNLSDAELQHVRNEINVFRRSPPSRKTRMLNSSAPSISS